MSDDRGVHVVLASAPDAVGQVTTLALEGDSSTITAALALGSRMARIHSPALDQWEALATLGSRDLGAARAIEPVLDAANILREAASEVDGPIPAGSTWGVFAAEGGDDPLTASELAGDWTLSGTKPWCSLADQLDNALVTARTTGGDRRLFSVELTGSGVRTDTESWHARGLVEIPSGPVRFSDVLAVPVGAPGWYLDRPGFAIGGIGVAACWYGGAVGIARTVYGAIAARDASDIALMHLGAIDESLRSAQLALAAAAVTVDAGSATPAELSVLAKRVRAVVGRACEEVILRAGHALGPAPLALDADHAKRVADLTLYIRQHHAEKDQVSLGRALLAMGEPPW
jgi:alkylation response protein AidB-like acyl-CoA dehydrogenase